MGKNDYQTNIDKLEHLCALDSQIYVDFEIIYKLEQKKNDRIILDYL